MWKPTGEIAGRPVQLIGGGRTPQQYIDVDGFKRSPGKRRAKGGGWLKKGDKPDMVVVPYIPYTADEVVDLMREGNTKANDLPWRLVKLCLESMTPGICMATDEFGNVANWKGGEIVHLCVANKRGASTYIVTIPENFPMLTVEIDGPKLLARAA